MIVLKRGNVPAVSHLDTSESKTCKVSLVGSSKHFKPDYLAQHLDFKGSDFADFMAY